MADINTHEKWSAARLADVMKTHTNPSTLDGFRRKDYCGKDSADLLVGDGAREFIAHVTTNTRDRDNEVLDPKGADFSLYLKNPVVLWGHRYDEPAIGRALWLKRWTENRKLRGLVSKGVVAEGVAKADQVFKLMQQKILNTVSVGFIPIEGHEPTEGDLKKNAELAGVNWIHDKWAMLEYSIVNVPSNPEATIDAVSKGTLEISAPLQQELGIYIPPNTIVDANAGKRAVPYKSTLIDGIDAGWSLTEELYGASIEQLAEMAAWSNIDNPDSLKSYKYIHHRKAPGHPVVFMGLVEAMSRLQTFAVRIPDEDRLAVWSHLARHFREYGKEPPELVTEPKSFELVKIDMGVIPAEEPIAVYKPVTVKALPVLEVPNAKVAPPTKEEMTEIATEAIEVKLLGRV